jgi:hypothetical protein
LVALAFSLVGTEVRAWFVELYLPENVRLVTSVLLALLGGSALAVARWLRKRGVAT